MGRASRRRAALLAGLALAIGGAAAADRGRIERVEHAAVGLPGLGPDHAPVTIDFFANLGDGYASGQVHGLLTELARRHPRRLRINYRLTPSIARQPNAHILAALEAHAQGHFIAFVDELYRDTLRSPREDALARIAERAGVDPARLAAAVDPEGPLAAERERAVRDSHFFARRHLVRRVPGLMVNGVPYDRRPTSIDELEELYDQALGQALARLDAGVPLDQLYPTLVAEHRRSQPEPVAGPTALDGVEPGERPPSLRPALVKLDPSRGEPSGRDDAPVTLTLFCNLVTRNCALAGEAVAEIAAAYPDQVRVVFRHLYDPDDPAQEHAARYARNARCAARFGQFDAIYDLALRRVRGGALDDDDLLAAAKDRGVPAEAFARCRDAPSTARAVAAELAAARREGVARTPALVIDGRLYLGVRSFDELSLRVDRALEPGVLGQLAP